MSEEEFLLAFERGRITADTLQKNIKEYITQHNLDIQPDILLKLMTKNPLPARRRTRRFCSS